MAPEDEGELFSDKPDAAQKKPRKSKPDAADAADAPKRKASPSEKKRFVVLGEDGPEFVEYIKAQRDAGHVVRGIALHVWKGEPEPGLYVWHVLSKSKAEGDKLADRVCAAHDVLSKPHPEIVHVSVK